MNDLPTIDASPDYVSEGHCACGYALQIDGSCSRPGGCEEPTAEDVAYAERALRRALDQVWPTLAWKSKGNRGQEYGKEPF
jgi:hypothetical protein